MDQFKGTLRQPGWSSFGWLNETQISIKRYHKDAKSKLCITKFFFKWTETFPPLIQEFSEALMGSVFGGSLTPSALWILIASHWSLARDRKIECALAFCFQVVL